MSDLFLTESDRAEALRALKKIDELYADKSKWGQGYCALDSAGQPVSCMSVDAACFCLIGAARYATNDGYYYPVRRAIMHSLPDKFKNDIASFNDAKGRTIRQIRNVVKKALKLVETTRVEPV